MLAQIGLKFNSTPVRPCSKCHSRGELPNRVQVICSQCKLNISSVKSRNAATCKICPHHPPEQLVDFMGQTGHTVLSISRLVEPKNVQVTHSSQLISRLIQITKNCFQVLSSLDIDFHLLIKDI